MSEGRVSRKIKQGKVDIDFQDCALLVNYDIEMVQTDDNGMVMAVLDRKPEVRRIKIKTLSVDKNMAQLASDIVDKCKYIHPSRTEEIEQLLIQLQRHTLAHANDNDSASAAATGGSSLDGGGRYNDNDGRGQSDGGGRRSSGGNRSSADRGGTRGSAGAASQQQQQRRGAPPPHYEALPPAYMTDLDDYLEMLYQVSGKSDKEKEEGLKMQERGTGMILQLCRDVMNLEQLIQNSTVMGALTRVLQEEYKKSIDLTFNILRIFLAFSNFMEMHSLMSNYRVGVLTMKAIEFEIKRSELRESERVQHEADFSSELEHARKEDLSSYPTVLEKVRRSREKEAAKYAVFSRKQDKLLFVGFYILLNLAEDITVERKMVRRQLLPSLIAMLKRRFEDLLILSVTFLKKLSTIEENKDAFKSLGVMDMLIKFIPCSSQPLITITLRLLFNLSFDKEMRDLMLKGGMVPKLVTLLKTPSFRAKTLKLLYHLSVDDRCKSMLTYTDGIPILMGLVINFPQDYLAKELAALMVNLSYNARNAEMMISNKGLNLLMDRFEDKRDPLLLKIIRNLTQWTFNAQQELENPELNYAHRGLWSPHIKTLVQVLREEDSHDLLVEVFGCLANMTVYDLPATSNWSKLTRDNNLVNLFSKMLVPGMAQNDLVLEIIMLISSIASDPQACDLISSSTLIGLLYQLWQEKSEDTEILLQLIHCFHKLFMCKSSREEAMYSTRVVVNIIECLHHRCSAVRQQAYKMCELVLEFDRGKDGEPGNLGRKIIQKQFESYNKHWMQAVMGVTEEDAYGLDDLAEADEYLMSPQRPGQRHHLSMDVDDEEDDDASPADGPHGAISQLASARFYSDKMEGSMEWKVDAGRQQQQAGYDGSEGNYNDYGSVTGGMMGGSVGYAGDYAGDGKHNDDDDDDDDHQDSWNRSSYK